MNTVIVIASVAAICMMVYALVKLLTTRRKP
jgi:hypothetical protein